MKDPLLEIYLEDHFASAQGALELVRRVERENEGTELGEQVTDLRTEMERDVDTLSRVMSAVGVERDRLKDAAAWLAEKLGRFKRNGSVTSYSPLSRVEELELLSSAVTAKRALWETLDETRPAGVSVEFKEMIAFADQQARKLHELHRRAVAIAFSPV